eukprot:SAG31_NODE_1785_length_7278_cov_4.205321_14_plen_88_part_00
MGDMISFEEQQKINAIGSRRRNSVSAESSSAMQAQMQLMAKAVSKIPKTDTQVKEIETAIGSNLLFQGLVRAVTFSFLCNYQRNTGL